MVSRVTTNVPTVNKMTGVPVWNPATRKGNFDYSFVPKKQIVLHTMDGFLEGTNAWFHNPNAIVTATYGVGLDGKIYQWVPENATSYNCGVPGKPESYLWNQQSISIETEDNRQYTTVVRTAEQYTALAQLVADIASFWQIPLIVVTSPNEPGIIAHHSLNPYKPCPGNLDINHIVQLAQSLVNKQPGSIVPPVPVQILGELLVTASAGVNVRPDPSTNNPPLRALAKNNVVPFHAVVEGVAVQGNKKWYQLAENGGFVWSGAVSIKTPLRQFIQSITSLGGR